MFPKGKWQESDSASIMHNARVMSEANFKRVFGQLPPVPQRPSPETFDPDEIENKSLLKALDRLIEERKSERKP